MLQPSKDKEVPDRPDESPSPSPSKVCKPEERECL